MKKQIAQTSTFLFLALTQASTALAQTTAGGKIGTTVDETVAPFTNFGKLLSNVIQVIMFVAGLFFFINLLYGGVQWIISGGDKAGTEAARNRITNSFIGLIIVVAAFAITLIVERVFGIPILSGFEFRPAERPIG